MIEKLQIPSTTKSGVEHTLTIDTDKNRVTCNCTGFNTHKYCKHIKIYKQRISRQLYGEDFVIKIINSFNNCYEFVHELCRQYPECIGNYDKLDYYSNQILKTIDKKYATETLHRVYRKLVENNDIVEDATDQLRKEKAETVMHDINNWSPSSNTGYYQKQTTIDGTGLKQ